MAQAAAIFPEKNTAAAACAHVVAIAGGTLLSLAVTSNGQVYAWGDNSYGQLGTNIDDVGSISSPIRVAGVSNAVLVSAHPFGGHSLAMTVDQGTNRYWAWGQNFDGQVGNGSNGVAAESTPVPVQFCTRCQRCVQLGTNGTFTAQCNGTLYLYFNGEIGSFGNYGGSYTVTVNNVTNTAVPATSGEGLENGGPGNGVSFGIVTNGGVYPYTANGFCTYNNTFGYKADADGRDSISSNLVNCFDFTLINKTNAVCPARQCFSLVGKIQ